MTLNNAGTDDVKQLAQDVLQAVDKFADGQEQADDQTILLWKWN
jgi:serine phosphatase RsbU (regulator of sigma subunit)